MNKLPVTSVFRAVGKDPTLPKVGETKQEATNKCPDHSAQNREASENASKLSKISSLVEMGAGGRLVHWGL